MSIKDKLQIFLITYNRKRHLQMTLESIFADNSPIRDFDITILDNASTDGTSELIEEYCQKFPNVTHIKNKINIGGNANICRAFEMGATSGKEYFWVLCDDDKYDFSNWLEVEKAVLSKRYDMIFTINHLMNQDTPKSIPALLFLSAFVPGCIYRSMLINSDLLINMYGNINTWYPHAIPSMDILINQGGSYYIPEKNVVIRVTEDDLKGDVFSRGQNKAKEHPDLSRMFWHVGYMKALRYVQDKKIREDLCEKVTFNEVFDETGKEYLKYVLDYNAIYKNNNIDNYWDIYRSVSKKLKFYMILYFIFKPIIYILYFYKGKNGIYVRLFNRFKTKIIPIKRTN